MEGTCLWCGQTFQPRTTGGQPQAYCCRDHKYAALLARKRYAYQADSHTHQLRKRTALEYARWGQGEKGGKL